MENSLINFDGPKKFTVLGEDNALCIYDPSTGFMKGATVDVKLRLSKNHFYGIKQVSYDNRQKIESMTYKLTAEGYDYINRFAGLKVIAPAVFEMNGVQYSNPTIEYDELGNKGKVMYVCAVAGRDPSGKIHVTPPVMTSFSQEESMITSLTNKIKNFEEYSRGKPGKEEIGPVGFFCPLRTRDKFLAKNDFYEYFPIAKNRGMIIDTSHVEFMKIEANAAAKRENIERTIVTVTKRNAMRRHPAIGTYTVNPVRVKDDQGNIDLVAKVQVKMWTGIDDELEDVIKENQNIVNPTQQDYDDLEQHDDMTDLDTSEIIVEDETIVTNVEQLEPEDAEAEVQEDIDAEEAKERADLREYIKKNWKAVGGTKAMKDFPVDDSSTIIELKAAKDFMERRLAEMAEQEEA